MAFQWSNEQHEAIYKRDSNILVSAGAGSGKTAVLTERIYQLIVEGAKIEDFLVLTFSNAAAAEMADRTRDKLSADPKFVTMANDIDRAHIETFDAFALYVVKRFHYYINVSQNVNIINASVLEVKKRNILEEVFKRYYDEKNPDFLKMISLFCIKDDKAIRNLVMSLSKISDLKIDKYKFYDNYVDDLFKEETINKYIQMQYIDYCETINLCIEMADHLENTDDGAKIIESFEALLKNRTYDDMYNAVMSYRLPRKPSGSDEDEALRKAIRKEFERADGPKCKFGTSKEIKNNFYANKPFVKVLVDIAKEVDLKLDAYKKECQCYSFSDIARMALKILKETPAQDILKNSFKYIMVDEYQDTSDIQEEMLLCLERNNLYMVGDVKQSIYRFRNANCQIFQEKYDRYKKRLGGVEIDLNQSFRSRREIVDAINNIFGKLMTKNLNPIDYDNGHHFQFGQKKYDENKPENQNYDVDVLTYPIEKGMNTAKYEASVIADDIIKKINSGYEVFDKKTGTLRKAKFSDFAILCDVSTKFDEYRTIFNHKNLPLNVRSDFSGFSSDLIYIIKNLCKLQYAVNCNDYTSDEFKHAFVSIARSFLIGYDDQTIYDYVMNGNFVDAPFMDNFKKISKKMLNASLYTILNELYVSFDLYHKIITTGNFKTNTNEAELLLNIASDMDLMGYTLKDFVLYFDDLTKFQVDMKFEDSSSNDNSVVIMTMHKSKGLEFPICYFPGMRNQFNYIEIRTSMIVSKNFGIALPITDSDLSNLQLNLIKTNEKQKIFEEKLRLYYVALTRAREKIIIVEGIKEKDKDVVLLSNSVCFRDFNNFAGVGLNCTKPALDSGAVLNKAEAKLLHKDFEIKHITPISSEIISTKKASKDVVGEVDQDLLDFGTRMHFLLEVLDYEKRDLSYIKDIKERAMVQKVLDTKIFDGCNNDDIIHEFKFYDEDNDTTGAIDCVIKKPNENIIIDFKLKNLDDEKYVEQLHTYRDFLKTISEKPIKMYLLSIVDGELKEVN